MTKKFFLSLVVLINSSIALAQSSSDNNQDIYYAMLAEEVNPAPQVVGAVNYQKSVGGLVCTKSTAMVPGAKARFLCDLSQDHNAKQIFYALNVVQVNRTLHVGGATNFEKTAGDLNCTRSRPVYPGAKDSYTCSFL